MTTCKHREEYGEGVELPAPVSLEHFDQCFDPEHRYSIWAHLQASSEQATRCWLADHEGALAELENCYLRLATLHGEKRARPRQQALHTSYRARARRRTRSKR